MTSVCQPRDGRNAGRGRKEDEEGKRGEYGIGEGVGGDKQAYESTSNTYRSSYKDVA